MKEGTRDAATPRVPATVREPECGFGPGWMHATVSKPPNRRRRGAAWPKWSARSGEIDGKEAMLGHKEAWAKHTGRAGQQTAPPGEFLGRCPSHIGANGQEESRLITRMPKPQSSNREI